MPIVNRMAKADRKPSFVACTQGMREWLHEQNRDRSVPPAAAVGLQCQLRDGKPVVTGYLSDMSLEQAVALASTIIRQLGRRTGRTAPVTIDPTVPTSDEGTPRPDIKPPPPTLP